MPVFSGTKNSDDQIKKHLKYLKSKGVETILAKDLMVGMGVKPLSPQEFTDKARAAGWEIESPVLYAPALNFENMVIYDLHKRPQHVTNICTAGVFDTVFWAYSLPIFDLENFAESWDIDEDELKRKDFLGMLQVFGRYAWTVADARFENGSTQRVAIPGMSRHIAFIREVYSAVSPYHIKPAIDDVMVYIL